MREEVRDIERLQHILEAMNVLVNYQSQHTMEEALADPVIYFGLVKHVEIKKAEMLMEPFREFSCL